jgi:hypothetical protein
VKRLVATRYGLATTMLRPIRFSPSLLPCGDLFGLREFSGDFAANTRGIRSR